ncbi:MAG: hypothetical protein FWD26_03585 [Treponema sp.]|nr:hypothetical protein [Treponema sp.]
MKRTLFLFLFFPFFALSANSSESSLLENLVSPAQAQQLRSGSDLIIETQLRNSQGQTPQPALLPQNSELRRIVNAARSSLNPNMFVESLYLYRKPGESSDDLRLGIFNQTTALSTLTGVQYYSGSRNEKRIFYEYSSIINNPSNKNPLPDPVHTQLPSALTLFARQKDLTFGDNIYRYDYTVTEQAIIFSQENVTALSIGIIPVIGRSKLRSVMAIIDCGDSFLIYAVSMVNTVSVPALRDRISGSFSSRAEAVLRWFTGRLDSELYN